MNPLRIFDIRGHCVDTLFHQRFEAGGHRILWQTFAFPSGIHIGRLESGSVYRIQRLTLLK